MKKRVLMVLVIVLVLAGFSACGGGEAEPSLPIDGVSVTYNEGTKILSWTGGAALTDIEFKLNGKVYKVSGNSYDIGALRLEDGEYNVVFSCICNKEPFSHELLIKIGNFIGHNNLIEFSDERGKRIKNIYRDNNYALKESDFPILPRLNGVEYSWDANVGDVVEKDMQIRIIVNYIEYSITYNLNGGELFGKTEYSETYTVREQNLSMYCPVKQLYLFGGWYETANFSDARVMVIDYANPRNYTLYAKWKQATADELKLYAYFDNTAKLDYFKHTELLPHEKIEIAVDKKNKYFHRIEDGKTIEVMTDGILYDYVDKSKASVTDDFAEKHMPDFGFNNVLGEMVSATITSSASNVKNYEITLPEGALKAEITGDIVTKLEMTIGGETGKLELSVAPFEKLKPNSGDFVEKVKITVTVLGRKQEQAYTFSTKSGGTLAGAYDSNMSIFGKLQNNMEAHGSDCVFIGYFSDKECTKPFSLDTP